VINHHFQQDIEALEKANYDKNRFEIVVVDNKKLFGLANCFFTDKESKSINIQYYSEKLKDARGKYYKVSKIIFKFVYAFYDFNILVIPSDLFFWIREFIRVVKENKIKVIVLDKEGTISPASYERHSVKIKNNYPFVSDKMYVWSERQKKFWRRAGMSKDKIVLVGQPRSDFFFHKERWKTKDRLGLRKSAKLITFFDYDNYAYVLDDFKNNISWKHMKQETHEILFEMAKKYPHIDFVFKVHPQQSDSLLVRNKIKKAKVKNVFLFTGTEGSNHLIVNSDLIIGFQSTVLLEAMLTDIPILYTFWDENIKKIKSSIIPFHAVNALEVIDRKDKFSNRLDYYLKDNNCFLSLNMKKTRKDFVSNYFYKADGKTSRRILEFLANE
jgi:hypothetical protein